MKDKSYPTHIYIQVLETEYFMLLPISSFTSKYYQKLEQNVHILLYKFDNFLHFQLYNLNTIDYDRLMRF